MKTRVIDVSDHTMKAVADQMGIPEFPYYVVYIEGDEEQNVHGPADGITAKNVMNALDALDRKEKDEEEQRQKEADDK